jgi:1-acyl-sn-glycerol-3-phosphate acyltransferase
MATLFSILYWCFLASTSMVLYPIAVVICLVTAPFDRNRVILHRYTCWWAMLYMRCLPGWRLRLEGRDKIRPGVPYVLVANHQSMADIMTLSSLAVPFKWVSKKEAFRLPCIGWNMYLNQYVKVDRGNMRSVRATLEECQRWLQRGVPLMMFPEGTRSRDGELHEFHSGAFKLAVDCGCAVVPVVCDGTGPIYQGLKVYAFPGPVTIRVLDPIAVTAETKDVKLRDEVFALMKRELDEIRGRALEKQPA